MLRHPERLHPRSKLRGFQLAFNKSLPSKPEQKSIIPDAQQSEPVVQKKGSKLFGRLPLGAGIIYVLVASILILIIVLAGSGILSKNLPTKESPSTPDSEIPAAAGPGSAEPELKIPVEQQLAESGVEQLLKNIYAGKIEPNIITKEISLFGKDYDFNIGKEKDEWIELRITVYPYIPGKKVMQGYESLPTWERSFDKEVELFLNLKPGKQITTVFDTTASPRVVEINFRKIGDRYFAVYDTSFAPSSTFTRHYFTHDKTNQQLIYVYGIFYDFYAVKSSLVKTADGQQAYHKDVVYPENFQGFLDKLEKLL